jgi:hypothetical protein
MEAEIGRSAQERKGSFRGGEGDAGDFRQQRVDRGDVVNVRMGEEDAPDGDVAGGAENVFL